MRWVVRETALIVALAASTIVISPSWQPLVVRAAIAGIGALVLIASLLALDRRVIWGADEGATDTGPSRPGTARRLREVPQAKDFALAVDYQLYPFLLDRLREVAVLRLGAHGLDVTGFSEAASRAIGSTTWRLLSAQKPGGSGVSLELLSRAVTELEQAAK